MDSNLASWKFVSQEARLSRKFSQSSDRPRRMVSEKPSSIKHDPNNGRKTHATKQDLIYLAQIKSIGLQNTMFVMASLYQPSYQIHRHSKSLPTGTIMCHGEKSITCSSWILRELRYSGHFSVKWQINKYGKLTKLTKTAIYLPVYCSVMRQVTQKLSFIHSYKNVNKWTNWEITQHGIHNLSYMYILNSIEPCKLSLHCQTCQTLQYIHVHVTLSVNVCVDINIDITSKIQLK